MNLNCYARQGYGGFKKEEQLCGREVVVRGVSARNPATCATGSAVYFVKFVADANEYDVVLDDEYGILSYKHVTELVSNLWQPQ